MVLFNILVPLVDERIFRRNIVCVPTLPNKLRDDLLTFGVDRALLDFVNISRTGRKWELDILWRSSLLLPHSLTSHFPVMVGRYLF